MTDQTPTSAMVLVPRDAAQRLLNDLNARIALAASVEAMRVPIFPGIAALHDALAAAPPAPAGRAEVERLREVVAGFVADLTDAGRNRGTCLSVNHDALNARLERARAALKEPS